MKIRYCCRWPNRELFMDTNGSKKTAVVYCSACQTIAAEIWVDTGKNVLGEEE